jgi:protein gp37
MNRTKIEWCDYTINPVKGLCPMACPYCYARRLYKRFKWNPEIRFEPEALLDLEIIPDGSKIFIGSTIELFHETIRPDWLDYIFWVAEKRPEVICIFLTKQPQNLPLWSPFPGNCWVGVTALNDAQLLLAETQFEQIKASIKFLSLEPLKNQLDVIKYMKQPLCKVMVIAIQQTTIKHFLTSLPVAKIKDAMALACSTKPNDPENALRYFCGICWNWIKKPETRNW